LSIGGRKPIFDFQNAILCVYIQFTNNFKPTVTHHFTKSFPFSELCVENEPILRRPAEIKEFGKAEAAIAYIYCQKVWERS
jgi:hypothetical protein